MNKHTDVLVVGGGFAGVTAARELGTSGYAVTLLEARDRLGGRTWYERDRIAGFDVEMGGGWLGDDEAFAMAEVDRYGIQLLRDDAAPQQLLWRSVHGVRRSVLPVPFDQLADLERAVLRMNQVASRIPQDLVYNPAELASLHDLEIPLPQLFEDLQLPTETHAVLEGFWSGISSAHWSQMSALHAARLIAASGNTFMGFM
ncbi:FAD-dependent oxidoreductase [Gordonia sp. Z-3]|uniref:FAD-dependent oxidoreductase n=1 Tax=Gordonia aquimaris TaxID=2984863 RepID=A0A9X3I6D2_9ACTN|nr:MULTISPECIES: FAD-dependent oxidoreductase [Gordonia]MCX2966748.1 FAD-dependent oxidoreductase [Gordonia aquimaris]MED5803231.1 FAD-dependent oxidoreductase [Gordonia sp. Z-3]